MTKRGWGIALAVSALASSGCQTAQMEHDAGLVIPDSAAANDASVSDASTPSPDTGNGTCGAAEGASLLPQLPTSCLPMCDDANRAALAACGPLDFQCRRQAVPFDAGAIVLVDTPIGPQMVSCGGSRTGSVWPCFGWQETSCEADFCPDEYRAYIQCINAGGSCAAEDTAVLNCLENSTDYQACVTQRIGAC